MKIRTETAMIQLGRTIAGYLKPPTVIELVGDVGAGKTTFTRGLAAGLGITKSVTSPSFTISKRYALPQKFHGGELIHYDFYRLPDPGIMREELSEALGQQNIIVLEWGGAVKNLLPKQHIRLEFTLNSDGSREVTISGLPSADCGKLVENFQNPVQNNQKTVENSPHLVKNFLEPVEKLCKNSTKSVQNDKNSVENLWKTSNLSKPSKTSKALDSANFTPKYEILSGFKCQNELSALPLFLDTSTELCRLQIGNQQYSWLAKNELAEKIFSFIHDKLQERDKDWSDITEIHFFAGPGSFTGLRIGAAVVNTLADQLKLPLFDQNGQNHQIIIPNYGRPANISTPRK